MGGMVINSDSYILCKEHIKFAKGQQIKSRFPYTTDTVEVIKGIVPVERYSSSTTRVYRFAKTYWKKGIKMLCIHCWRERKKILDIMHQIQQGPPCRVNNILLTLLLLMMTMLAFY